MKQAAARWIVVWFSVLILVPVDVLAHSGGRHAAAASDLERSLANESNSGPVMGYEASAVEEHGHGLRAGHGEVTFPFSLAPLPTDSRVAPAAARPPDLPPAETAGQHVKASAMPTVADDRTHAETSLDRQHPEEVDHALPFAPLESMMFQAIARQREGMGLQLLELDQRIAQLARQRSLDMAENNYFSHMAPDGTTARSLMIAARIGPGLMGEILGRNNSPDVGESVALVVRAFMESPSHRRSILNPRFQTVGVGAATDSQGMKYYTILFFGP